MKKQLTPQLKALLEEVVQKHRPDLLPLLPKAQSAALAADEQGAFLEAISSEFCATGRQADDEPNERGLLLETLLDCLNQR